MVKNPRFDITGDKNLSEDSCLATDKIVDAEEMSILSQVSDKEQNKFLTQQFPEPTV